MTNVEIKVNDEDMDKIFNAFLKWGEPLNHAIDVYMMTKAKPFNAKVRSKLPISNRSKEHAKHIAESLTLVDLWMGFASKTNSVPKRKQKQRFGYLFFPETGTGYTQKNTGAQQFFERTLEEEQDGIVDGVIELVDNFIMTTLK